MGLATVATYVSHACPCPLMLHVNCFAVIAIRPFTRPPAGVAVCSTAFLFAGRVLPFCYGFVFQIPSRRSTRSKQPSSQALESLVASPPRRRPTAVGNDNDPALCHPFLVGRLQLPVSLLLLQTDPLFLQPCLTSWFGG